MTMLVSSHRVSKKPRRASKKIYDLILGLPKEDVTFMQSPLYKGRNIEEKLFPVFGLPPLPSAEWYSPSLACVADDKPKKTSQLLSSEEERLMFHRFNYARMRLGILHRKAQRNQLTPEDAQNFYVWDHRVKHFREYIIRCNLPLVLSMFKRKTMEVELFDEAISNGNEAVMRAVNKFDVDRGFKFSTYCCRAIIKGFSRLGLQTSRRNQRFPLQPDFPDVIDDWVDRRRQEKEFDLIDYLKTLISQNAHYGVLSDVELVVLKRRFNLDRLPTGPLTLDEVGDILGLTKERIRQIQNNALAKLREAIEDEL